MNRDKALTLIDIIVSEGSSPVDKKRAEMQLRELICLLFPQDENEESHD